MTLEQLANIAEIFGMAVVAITLIFLTVQIRQNTRAVRLRTFHTISEAFRTQYALIGGSELVAAVYRTGLTRPQELKDVARMQFYALMHNQVRGYENAFYQQAEGALDARYWAGMQGQMLNTCSAPGFIQYWNDRRGWYSESFQRHVDDVLIPGAKDLVFGGAAASA